ncbi:MAG: aldo/keto reductase [Alphaproteobacteria bacterium]|nr:aldo/keto reductase [Alphaproteobacteria bacterium]
MNTPSVEANGARIPLIGLGTWDLRGKACARAVEEALALGYRHIDTAAMYRNEDEVGAGLRASGVKRGDVFVTTKVWSSNLRASDFERSARDSLKNLKLDQVDLLLIHWPNSSVPLKETMGALCKMKRDGVARHIGVSNFTPALIGEAVKFASEPLVTNQIELHPYLDQSKTIAASRKAGLCITAYTPIARGRVTGDALLSRIGKQHGRSAAQVCLRYLVQQDIVVIPKTSRLERMRENAAIFDFALSPNEMKEIAALASPHGNIVS